MKLSRLTRSELNLLNSCIDMASVEFEGKKDEIKEKLACEWSHTFFYIRYSGSEFYYFVVEADLEAEVERLRFIRLSVWCEDKFYTEVQRKGEGVCIEYLKYLFHDLKLHLKRLREQTIFLELCSIVEATQKRSELTDGDDLYFIEYEVRDSHLVLYALKTIGGNTSLMAEFKTKETFTKGISGLRDQIISYYTALKNISEMCMGG